MTPRFRFEPHPSFEERQATNSKLERIDNARLPAGSPMYYYCRLCGQTMVLPETHLEMAPRYCEYCIDEGRARTRWEVR
jgi:hypothetical protein